MPKGDDVYGALLEDALAGRRAHEVVERDDGYVMAFGLATHPDLGRRPELRGDRRRA